MYLVRTCLFLRNASQLDKWAVMSMLNSTQQQNWTRHNHWRWHGASNTCVLTKSFKGHIQAVMIHASWWFVFLQTITFPLQIDSVSARDWLSKPYSRYFIIPIHVYFLYFGSTLWRLDLVSVASHSKCLEGWEYSTLCLLRTSQHSPQLYTRVVSA